MYLMFAMVNTLVQNLPNKFQITGRQILNKTKFEIEMSWRYNALTQHQGFRKNQKGQSNKSNLHNIFKKRMKLMAILQSRLTLTNQT